MKSTIAILIILITSCAAVSFNSMSQYKTEDIVNACFARSINMCGDLICEMSVDDNAEIIKTMWDAMDECIVNPQNIDKRYFDKGYQERMRQ